MKRSLHSAVWRVPIALFLTFLLSSARLPYGVSPFYLGVFATSVSLGENFLIAALVFLGGRTASALTLSSFSVAGLVQSVFAAAAVGIGAAVQRLRRRRYHGFYAVLLAFFGQLFTLFFLPPSALYLFLANVALGALFALLTTRLFGTKRARIFLFTNAEKVLVMICLFALGAGAYGVSGRGVTPYYLLLSAAVPVFAALGTEGIAYAFSLALGAVATCGDGLLILPVALAVLLSEGIKGARRLTAFSLLLSETCVFFAFHSGVSPYNFILLFAGGLFAALLPEDVYRKLIVHFGKGEEVAARSLVNKTRLDLSGKLGCMSDALRQMSGSLFFLSSETDEGEVARRIARALSKKLCEGCRGIRDCARQAGGDTADILLPTVLRGIRQGKATIVDLSSYLNSNCHKVKPLIEGINEHLERYEREKAGEETLRAERAVMASEAEGIADILDALKKDTRRIVTFDGKRERRIIRELAAEGITAYDAMVAEEDGDLEVTVTMSEKVAEDPRAAKGVSRALGVPLIAESVGIVGAGNVSVHFVTAPYYDVIVGEAVEMKEGNEACGDNKSVTRLGSDKVMIALSDGMGSGEEAGKGSAAAISLVENFYKTGVDEKVLLPLINRLLSIRNEGAFQTLDMCVIDLRTGVADFIKLSAPGSVIKRKEGTEVVEGSALPLGILREVKPSISRKQLSAGDLVILMTDGITDAIGTDGVVRVVESGRTHHPRIVAENVLQDASYVSSSDDKTVVAVRLYRRLDG